MARMSQLKYAIAAAVLVSTLWAQDAVSPGSSAAMGPGPMATKIVRPIYPFTAVKDKLQGKVVVKVVITDTGDVESAEAISGDPTLAQTAVDAAKQWKFKPYLKDGSPAKIAINLPFAFRYLDKPSDTPPESFWRDVPRDLITVRLAEGGSAGMIAHKVQPEYPPIARTARIQGNVSMFVVIGKDGAVHDVRVIEGHPLLRQASIDAVIQWRYKPVLLDGQPIDAQTVIVISFALSGLPM